MKTMKPGGKDPSPNIGNYNRFEDADDPAAQAVSSSSRQMGSVSTMTAPGKTRAPTHEQIAKRAKAIWMQRGCKPGEDEKNWLEAEAQLRAELAKD